MSKALVERVDKKTAVTLDKDGYKIDCGWRKEGLCFMRKDQCTPRIKERKGLMQYCDLFDAPFEKKAIEQKVKAEQKLIKEYHAEHKRLKRENTDRKELKKIRLKLTDKVKGLEILSRGYDKLSDGIFSKMALKSPRLKKWVDKLEKAKNSK